MKYLIIDQTIYWKQIYTRLWDRLMHKWPDFVTKKCPEEIDYYSVNIYPKQVLDYLQVLLELLVRHWTKVQSSTNSDMFFLLCQKYVVFYLNCPFRCYLSLRKCPLYMFVIAVVAALNFLNWGTWKLCVFFWLNAFFFFLRKILHQYA